LSRSIFSDLSWLFPQSVFFPSVHSLLYVLSSTQIHLLLCWAWRWLPAIPATWEVEIRKITVQGQSRKNVYETPSQQMSWPWWFPFVNPSQVEGQVGGLLPNTSAKQEPWDSVQKVAKAKTWPPPQVVEDLPKKLRPWIQIPESEKKKNSFKP
jgi:hypothetical protein